MVGTAAVGCRSVRHLEGLVDLIPDSLVDELQPTADVLRWSLDRIDVNTVLAGLDDRKSLKSILSDTLVKAAIDEAKRQINEALPGPLQGISADTDHRRRVRRSQPRAQLNHVG